MPQLHTVLEVRPLRALLPLLSTTPEFCALNLYQLALMATLADGLRDADALQAPFEEGGGKVHQGFYGAAKKAAAFVIDYHLQLSFCVLGNPAPLAGSFGVEEPPGDAA